MTEATNPDWRDWFDGLGRIGSKLKPTWDVHLSYDDDQQGCAG